MRDARRLNLIDKFPYQPWWTFALDRCYPENKRHTGTCKSCVAAKLVATKNLLRDLYDSNPCWHDHHGHCQSHGWFGEELCPQLRIKKLLGLK